MGAPELLQHLREAGLSVSLADGDGIRIAPAGALTDNDRQAIRDHRAELLSLLRDTVAAQVVDSTHTCRSTTAEPWTDAEIAAFTDRYNRLRRWGWSEAAAEQLAERLARRDRDVDDRVSCAAECRHYRLGRCGSHKAAGLTTAEVGRDLAAQLQRCAGFCAVDSSASSGC